MARNRQLSANIRKDDKVNEWPIELRYFWTMLWGYCDDYGRGEYHPKLIKSDAFPLDDEVTSDRVGRWMQALELSGVIRSYEVNDRKYFYCVNWSKYQRLSRPTSSDIPEPHAVAEHLHADVLQTHSQGKGKGREVEGEGKAQALTPFCVKHPKGTDGACRACGNARLAYQAALLAVKNKPTPVPPRTLEDCTDHPGYPLPCVRCAETKVA